MLRCLKVRQERRSLCTRTCTSLCGYIFASLEVTKPEQQKQCLQLAKDAGKVVSVHLFVPNSLVQLSLLLFSGLDVAAITKTVVETVRKRGMVCVCVCVCVCV